MTLAPKFELVDVDTGNRKVVDAPVFVVGRHSAAHFPLYHRDCSRHHFHLVAAGADWFLEPQAGSAPTRINGQLVRERVPLQDGMLIQAGAATLRVQQLPDAPPADELPRPALPAPPLLPVPAPPATTPQAADRQGPDQTVQIEHSTWASDAVGLGLVTFPLVGDTIIGRADDAKLRLPHVQVSRRHAWIRRQGDVTLVQDLGSTNGTYLNGRRLILPDVLLPGARLDVGPYALTFTGDSLVATSRTNNSQLEGRNLLRTVADRTAAGGRKILLDRVSMVVRPGEFVCLLGPAGSGKTTLLSALSARLPVDEGEVWVNQTNLRQHFESLKQDIALVPQRDVLHEQLNISEGLRYTAKLRLPADTSAAERKRQIEALLEATGLEQHCRTRIRNLSGGQRRRASLANELIANPSLLFLDEVTSGLDQQTDREMMRLFRRLADAGKTVVCVTHMLANVEENCHLVVLLTYGGKLAFVGSPQEALSYFQIARLGDVYERLGPPERAEAWQRQFRESPYYARYVAARLSPDQVPAAAPPPTPRRRGWNQAVALWRQLPVLLARYGRVFFADWRAAGGLLLQCLVVALVLYLVFGRVGDLVNSDERLMRSCQVLFVLGVSCFWFGCNNSAKEIVKERAIYTKELQVNLDPASYQASKYLLQFLVAALQSGLLLLLVSWSCRLSEAAVARGGYLILAAGAGVALGLFLSALALTEELALTLVPLVVIPQIILSDIFVTLTGFSKFLGQSFVTNYWTFGLLRRTVYTDPKELNSLPAAGTGITAVLCQTLLLFLGAAAILHVRDRLMATSGKSFWQVISEMPLVHRCRQAWRRVTRHAGQSESSG